MHRRFLCLPLLALLIALAIAPARAQSAALQPRIEAHGDTVMIDWRPPAVARSAAALPIEMIPRQLVTLQAPLGVAIRPQVVQLNSHSWDGHVVSPQIVPRTLEGHLRPDLAAASAGLPTAPLLLLRDSVANGMRLVVLQLAGLYDDGSGPQQLDLLTATIPGVTLYTQQAAALPVQQATRSVVATPPNNPAAQNAVARLSVAHEGLQRVTGAALAASGVTLATVNPSGLRLFHQGQELAIELVGIGDGSFDAADELRFFAAAPGDRWNTTDTYWLVNEATPGQRMGNRTATPVSSTIVTVATEQAIWREGHIYDTTLAGPLGDHWYGIDMKADPSGPSEVVVTIPLTLTLPLATGQLSVTIEGAAYTSGSRTLIVRSGGSSQAQTWSGVGSWSKSFTLSVNPATIDLALQRGASPAGIEIQRVRYARPVQLSLNGQGTIVAGAATVQRYQASGSASGRRVYDVTDPRAPVLLTVPASEPLSFEDLAARRYLISGPGVEYSPSITRYTPVDLSVALNAQALYISPQIFQAGLAPLVARRQAQGYSVQVVDVQAIYDNWSDGQVDPNAIRNFLRYARDTWATKPVAVTLVGDGTADPYNYVGRNNINYIPPYLAPVDPYIVETACETCYAQLDGADPLSDQLPDILLGRLPVKSAAEIQALVAKILNYETGPVAPDWHSRAVFVTDNDVEADGTLDQAAGFATLAEQSVARLPSGIEARRMYYDPSPTRPNQPWREPDAVRAHAKVQQLISEGAALVTYVGHGSQFQWAVTDSGIPTSYLLTLFDADGLTNQGRAGIVREMTCLTGAFQTMAFSGTSIDERLLLQPSGAVAVWGSSGLGVSHGHDLLAKGFDQALWQPGVLQPTIGSLTQAGFTALYTQGVCCQDSIWTYLLLGDPLTGVRTVAAQRVQLPLVVR